jgi:hypothetical protein
MISSINLHFMMSIGGLDLIASSKLLSTLGVLANNYIRCT